MPCCGRPEGAGERSQERVDRSGRHDAELALGLSKTTYFTSSQLHVVPIAAITKVVGKAPPGLRLELEELIPEDPDLFG